MPIKIEFEEGRKKHSTLKKKFIRNNAYQKGCLELFILYEFTVHTIVKRICDSCRSVRYVQPPTSCSGRHSIKILKERLQ